MLFRSIGFEYLGGNQIKVSDPQLQGIVESVLSKIVLSKVAEKGVMNDQLEFTPSAEGTLERIKLSSNKTALSYNVRHNIGGQLEPTSYLVQGQKYAIDVIHPTLKDIDYASSKGEGKFMNLYNTLFYKKITVGGKEMSFQEYVTTGAYKQDQEDRKSTRLNSSH